jgi:predicted branched-subunit amino acid permease
MNRLDATPFTWAGIRSGAVAIGPFAASTAAFGIAFGVLASQHGLTLLAATGMSATVYAGSAQMVALQLWDSPVPLIPVWLATIAMNARYILMGASLRPWFGGLSPARAYGTLALLGDANWMVGMREHAAGRRDAGSVLGGGALMYLAWVSSTAAGHALGGILGSPRRWGLDFMLPAFCATMVISLWRGRVDLRPIIVAAVVTLVAGRFLPGQWHILAGGLVGSLAGIRGS